MIKIRSILLSIFIFTFNTQASSQYFEFRDAGEIQFINLEREISPGLDYADVDILNIRSSYNPIAYLSSLTSEYNYYVITMVVNDRTKVSCELTEITDEKKMMIKLCKGSREEVIHVGYVYYKDLK